VVFVCQNNQWGEHTPIAQYAPSTELAQRAASYNMPTVKVDGFDPLACLAALQSAVDRARRDEGPTFLEFVHYRLTGHTGTADYSYVPKEELAKAMERDPAPTFRKWLLEQSVFSESEIEAIESEVRTYVDDAFSYAESCPFPAPEELYTDVFADPAFVRSLSDV
jgi:pyruvate dehydrogenase E1 component alpha subunit